MFRFFLFAITAMIISFVLDCGQTAGSEDARPRVVNEDHSESEPLSAAKAFTDEDYKQRVQKLKKKVPEEFTIVIQRPFIVIGDEKPVKVKYRAEKTIKWAVTMLRKDYFEKDPLNIIEIWLFKDDSSYYKHTNQIFGDKPTTPFGYYLETERALIMNINTGGGTLVHEIVHPFIRANFPGCPAWFNEGLASLYEQCCEKNGHMYGLTNWRLAGLQEAIKQGIVPPFDTLFSMNEYQFYTKDKGTNYGQARYLCYYLQVKGLLVKFYHEFCVNQKDDPTGIKTIKKILDIKDMKAFKKEWEEFVLKLTFP